MPMKILVAEDNAVNQRVVQQLLAHLGYRVDLAGNGLEVLDALERQTYDLILMDVQMPQMDGLEATRRIRARHGANAALRIIAMTANALPGDRDLCLEAGMDGYLAKPIELDGLRASIAREHEAKTSASDPAGPAILNTRRLDQLYELQDEDNPRLVAGIVDLFITDSPTHLAALSRAAENGDAPALKATAHRFLSSIENLGALRMREPCMSLEKMGQEGQTAGAAALIKQLGDEFIVVRAALSDRVRGIA
jgi:CheY-like chemotaxis protein